jgi:hypothetical protein
MFLDIAILTVIASYLRCMHAGNILAVLESIDVLQMG